MRSRKWLKSLAFVVFLAFGGVELSEGYIHHHHEKTEDNDPDCAYCSFHKAFSNADFSIAPLVDLVPLFFLFLTVLVFFQSFLGSRYLLPTGRAPPVTFS
jgi:hypothetical protein